MTKTDARLLLAAAAAVMVACGPSDGGEEDAAGYESAPEEESGEQLAKDQTYDRERAGTRLVLAYDEQAGAFAGMVENVGDEPLSRVRVEVHLSNGVELGPSSPGDLVPGETMLVSLDASGETFETWSAHAEVGGAEDEHGDDEHDGRESEKEGRSERSGEGEESREHDPGTSG